MQYKAVKALGILLSLLLVFSILTACTKQTTQLQDEAKLVTIDVPVIEIPTNYVFDIKDPSVLPTLSTELPANMQDQLTFYYGAGIYFLGPVEWSGESSVFANGTSSIKIYSPDKKESVVISANPSSQGSALSQALPFFPEAHTTLKELQGEEIYVDSIKSLRTPLNIKSISDNLVSYEYDNLPNKAYGIVYSIYGNKKYSDIKAMDNGNYRWDFIQLESILSEENKYLFEYVSEDFIQRNIQPGTIAQNIEYDFDLYEEDTTPPEEAKKNLNEDKPAPPEVVKKNLAKIESVREAILREAGVKLSTKYGDVIELKGQPSASGEYQGAYYLCYDDVTYFYSGYNQYELVGIALWRKNTDISGLKIGDNKRDIISLLGTPDGDGYFEHDDMWIVSYGSKNTKLLFRFDEENSPLSTIEVMFIY